MTVVFQGGPLDGQTDINLREEMVIYRRHYLGPSARYKTTGLDDARGFRIFEHWPPKADEPEPTEQVHDA